MGNVDKKTVGSGAQGLIHISWLEKGWDITRLFMNMVSTKNVLRIIPRRASSLPSTSIQPVKTSRCSLLVFVF